MNGNKNILDIYKDILTIIHMPPLNHKSLINFFLSELSESVNNWCHFNDMNGKPKKFVQDQTDLELYGILTPHVLKNHFDMVSEDGKKKISKSIDNFLYRGLYTRENQLQLHKTYLHRKRYTTNIPPSLSLMKRGRTATHSFLTKKNVKYFLSEIKKGTVVFSFLSLATELNKYANYNQKKKRNVFSKKENKFWELYKENNIRSKNIDVVHGRMQDLKFSIGRSTVAIYLAKKK